jgi:hypothetical protein
MTEFEPDAYRPVNRRRRLLLALLALATAALLIWAMTRREGMLPSTVPMPNEGQRCLQGQTEGCLGSITRVIAAPVAVPASAPASR